jgi:hypothetical protein
MHADHEVQSQPLFEDLALLHYAETKGNVTWQYFFVGIWRSPPNSFDMTRKHAKSGHKEINMILEVREGVWLSHQAAIL